MKLTGIEQLKDKRGLFSSITVMQNNDLQADLATLKQNDSQVWKTIKVVQIEPDQREL